MRVLVTGASGLLGTWLLRTVPDQVEVVAGAHRTPVDWPRSVVVDLRNRAATAQTLADIDPDLVLHAAYRKDRTSIVAATEHVATACRDLGADMIAVSTEAVFSGDGRVRDESAPPDPISPYGEYKAEAEVAASHRCPQVAVVRIPRLISLDPPDADVRTVTDAVANGEEVTWYEGEARQAAMAEDVARGLWQLVDLRTEERAGTWHLPGPELLTRRQIGRRIAVAVGVDDPGTEGRGPASGRPKDLRLSADRARTHINWNPRPIVA